MAHTGKKEEATMKIRFLKRSQRLTRHHYSPQEPAGAVARELYRAVVTAALNDQFYTVEDARLQNLRSLVARNDPAFIAGLVTQLASIPVLRNICFLLIIEMDRQYSSNNLISALVEKQVQQAADLVILLQYYTLAHNKKSMKQAGRLSKQLQKGLQAVCHRIDTPWLQSCAPEWREKLKDVIELIQPKPKDAAQAQLFARIVNSEIPAHVQWEAELEILKQQAFDSRETREAAFSEKWEAVIRSNNLTDAALLKYIKNIARLPLSAGTRTTVYNRIGTIDNPLLSPFCFLHHYRELLLQDGIYTTPLLAALEQAAQRSMQYIPGFNRDTKVLVAADVSSSMLRHVSIKSKVQNFDIAPLLALLLRHHCDELTTGLFGDKWKTIHLPAGSALAATEAFYRREGEVGYAANGYLAIDYLLRQQKVVDKIMLFTDCPLWNSRGSEHLTSLWKSYKQLAPGASLYLFDLAGYDNTPLHQLQDDVFLIAGWNDRIFNILAALEQEEQVVKKAAGLVFSH